MTATAFQPPPAMDEDYRVALLALKAIVQHERMLKGTTAHDPLVWTAAYTALNHCGYLDRPIPAAKGAASGDCASPTLVNDGHGHVRPRADGDRKRCGGPKFCPVCDREKLLFVCPQGGGKHSWTLRVGHANSFCEKCGFFPGPNAGESVNEWEWRVSRELKQHGNNSQDD